MDGWVEWLRRETGVRVSTEAEERLVRFARLLWEAGQRQNLFGYQELDELWRYGILDAVRLFEVAEPSGQVVDVGSGGGLPGLVWASLGQGVRLTLLEATRRKVVFLDEAVRSLGLAAEVVWGRAEEVGRGRLRERFDGAVARALAPAPAAVELVAPLVAVGGRFWLARGEGEDPGAAGAKAELVGARLVDEVVYELPDAGRRAVWVFEKEAATPAGYPRAFARIRRDSGG
jgi:16S rRNA (guanine527-N7)-methyltransferase